MHDRQKKFQAVHIAAADGARHVVQNFYAPGGSGCRLYATVQSSLQRRWHHLHCVLGQMILRLHATSETTPTSHWATRSAAKVVHTR
jgi:hypothetical protein